MVITLLLDVYTHTHECIWLAIINSAFTIPLKNEFVYVNASNTIFNALDKINHSNFSIEQNWLCSWIISIEYAVLCEYAAH